MARIARAGVPIDVLCPRNPNYGSALRRMLFPVCVCGIIIGCAPRNVPRYVVFRKVIHVGKRSGPIEREIAVSGDEWVYLRHFGRLREHPRDTETTYDEDLFVEVRAKVDAPDSFSLSAEDIIFLDGTGARLFFDDFTPSEDALSIWYADPTRFTLRRIFRLKAPGRLVLDQAEKWYELTVTFRYKDRSYTHRLGRIWFSKEEMILGSLG